MNIFVSYRRSDTPDVSGRIYDELTGHLSADAASRDVDNIPLDVHFVRYLDQPYSTQNVPEKPSVVHVSRYGIETAQGN